MHEIGGQHIFYWRSFQERSFEQASAIRSKKKAGPLRPQATVFCIKAWVQGQPGETELTRRVLAPAIRASPSRLAISRIDVVRAPGRFSPDRKIGLVKEEEAAVNKNGKRRSREQSAERQPMLVLRGGCSLRSAQLNSQIQGGPQSGGDFGDEIERQSE